MNQYSILPTSQNTKNLEIDVKKSGDFSKNLEIDRLADKTCMYPAWALDCWAGKSEKLLTQQENLLVWDNQTAPFFEP